MSEPTGSQVREHWDAISDQWQDTLGRELWRRPMCWGTWALPEVDVKVLGDVRGKTVLDLGCGAGQWTAALREAGASPVGLDISERQLKHARAHAAAGSWVQADATRLPFPDETFDVVLSDHGGLSWVDPERGLPEVRRVLKPAGRVPFLIAGPLVEICWDDALGGPAERVRRDYFSLTQDGQPATFNRTLSGWFDLLRAAGLRVERVIETRPEAAREPKSTDWIPVSWARQWPGEILWMAIRAD